jgi:hypothetical protein
MPATVSLELHRNYLNHQAPVKIELFWRKTITSRKTLEMTRSNTQEQGTLEVPCSFFTSRSQAVDRG